MFFISEERFSVADNGNEALWAPGRAGEEKNPFCL
jgi:hypothetical protein